MKKHGIYPDSATFTILLSECANSNMYEEGVKIHELAKQTLKDFTIELSNTIINFYTKCGYSNIAIEECEKLKQKGLMNVVTWTCLIQAYIQQNDIEKAIDMIIDMKKSGVYLDSTTFTILLSACANSNMYEEGVKIHELAKQTLKDFTFELSDTIINFYTKCGYSNIAIEECEKLKHNGLMNVVTWNCLIQAYIQQNDIEKAIDMIIDMKKHGVVPNSTTFTILLSACANSNMYEEGVKIHELAKQTLKVFSLELSTATINFYTKCGYSNIAIEECEKLKQKGLMNVVTWTCLIQAYIQQNDIEKAMNTIINMKKSGVVPNSTTFTILLSACANSNMYEEGVKIHELAKQTLKDFTIELSNTIINFYTKCGYSNIAIEECEKLKQNGLMNVVTWNCLIQAYIQQNDMSNTHTPSDAEYGLNKAFRVYQEMKQKNFEPNSYTFSILMAACGEYVASNIGIQIIEDIKQNNMDIYEEVISGMVYFYSRVGQKETAQQLFDNLVRKKDESKEPLSIVTYTNMLSCYAQHGKGYEAQKLFDEIVEKKVKIDEITLIVLLNAYSHCGMVEEAIQLYNDMKPKHNFNPTLSIDCVMIDVFSRAGRFEEAEKLIGSRNDIGLWGALMGGCRKFNKIELGEKVFNKMTTIDEKLTSPYILLSHIYTYHGLNEKANKLQKLMRKRGIKKLPGIVYHEENGIVFRFISGSDDHKEDSQMFAQIERMRDEIFRKIIKAGYRPDTRWVTRTESLSEEEKVNLLYRHAEKTAIAHAFVLNPNRKKIVLTKNLRVCNDCHSATTYISKVMDVEIIVRDANRYHHFKDGKCSCGGYW
ncbi:predicted protein [Naegleria gruberi]|uniref:Predicted protein n=1 Tax=Naegleria gruberi TaxID=5762 RepID=D2UZ95_NAEGR|nr:uncharacterized protein NAEGRDRAFT_45424 [Naegleria gruberi]EFC49906.1 predicted protein [Naegleria gruberi]|eukprot:XP_002682650.1 predicted protein [Naegleria gruberi strain NEG-M]